jgi:hypothetical protein
MPISRRYLRRGRRVEIPDTQPEAQQPQPTKVGVGRATATVDSLIDDLFGTIPTPHTVDGNNARRVSYREYIEQISRPTDHATRPAEGAIGVVPENAVDPNPFGFFDDSYVVSSRSFLESMAKKKKSLSKYIEEEMPKIQSIVIAEDHNRYFSGRIIYDSDSGRTLATLDWKSNMMKIADHRLTKYKQLLLEILLNYNEGQPYKWSEISEKEDVAMKSEQDRKKVVRKEKKC